MWTLSVFDQSSDELVAETELPNVEWPSLRAALDIPDAEPAGGYPLSEEGLAIVRPLLHDDVGSFRDGWFYVLEDLASST
ncbi:DUF7683 domain-containing protein [Actinomadura rudentiformis]